MGSVSVREVLTLPVLRETAILAGTEGLERRVTGVNVMEVPDIESFVASGELLLTTAYPLREQPERLTGLVEALADRGVAALAVKMGRYLDALPSEMITRAEELDFPVLQVRNDLSFNEVITALLAVVLTDYGADPSGAEVIRERLTGVALAGGGLSEIARTLAGSIERPVQILDNAGAVLGSAAAGSDTMRWSFPVQVAGRERGRIVVGRTAEPSLGERRLILQACFAAGMHVAQALASVDLDRRMRTVFLEDLVAGRASSDEVMLERYRLFGWDFTTPHYLMMATCDRELQESAVEAAAHFLVAGAIAWTRGMESIVLVPAQAVESSANLALRWRSSLLRLGVGEATVAVSPRADRSADFARCHGLARDSIAVARSTGRTAVSYDELALERLLLAVPAELLAELVQSQLGPLIAAEETGSAGLCETLQSYLGLGNAAEAARQLFIHYNTMKHRMTRISELLQVDLQEPRTRLMLMLALAARGLRDPG